ncbi:MAG: hypothetical protein BJG00_016920 [Limnothrix sp. CACIAM 69d]|nr:MAG: hypothetical protein BJG00_016920 [Limnothrix sp. CACIAM 69d]
MATLDDCLIPQAESKGWFNGAKLVLAMLAQAIDRFAGPVSTGALGGLKPPRPTVARYYERFRKTPLAI